MARPLRVEYPGALYHVISRGDDRVDVFQNNNDRFAFLKWLEDTIKKHNIICHAYCLMDNHYHLLIETPDANLSCAMRDLNGHYTQWFNAIHDRVGHLFQGRYKAFLIEKEQYLLEVARYIVLNPVRARFVDSPRRWRWSSYCATAGISSKPKWLEIDWLLSVFSKKGQSHGQYRKFVRDGMNGKNPYDDVTNGFLLGSPQFVQSIWEKTNGTEDKKEHPRHERVVGRPSLQEIFEDVKTKEERNDAIIFAKIRCGYLASEIARFIGLDSAVVGRISRGTYNNRQQRQRQRKVGSRT